MKNKFIGLMLILMLVVALVSWAAPILSPHVDAEAAGASIIAEVVDLDIMASETTTAVIVAEVVDLSPIVVGSTAVTDVASEAIWISGDYTAQIPTTAAGETFIWLALGASLLTTAVANGRRLRDRLYNITITSLRNLRDSTIEGAGTGAGVRTGI